MNAGITQLVEYQLPKLNVAGSIPVARSRYFSFPCEPELLAGVFSGTGNADRN